MSADNWAVCPRCKAREEARIAELKRRADEAYGKIPVAEFDALRREAETPLDAEKFRTFREDWEIGIFEPDLRQLFISYAGSCSVCGLEAEHRHEATIYDPAEDDELADA